MTDDTSPPPEITIEEFYSKLIEELDKWKIKDKANPERLDKAFFSDWLDWFLYR